MRIFLSYKQSWINQIKLSNNLKYIRDILDNLWYDNFIYFFDKKRQDETSESIVDNIKKEIQKSDIVLCLIMHSQKSEWQLLEIWFTEWIGKRLIILIDKNIKKDYFLSCSIPKNNDLIVFSDIKEIENILKSKEILWNI